MKKIILLLCLCLMWAPSFAAKPKKERKQAVRQEHTQKKKKSRVSGYDNKAIRLQAKQDDIYLPLVERFEMCDTTLTTDDLSLLYYGFAFRPGYKGSVDAMSSPVFKLMKEEKYREAWEQGLDYLKKNPVSLTTLEGIVKAGAALELPEEDYMPYFDRMIWLLLVIEHSGNGHTPETAFRVISVPDEYTYMRIVRQLYKLKSQALIKSEYGPCDAMVMIDENEVECEPIYFNVSLPMEHLSRLLGEKTLR